jgi:hypothetical protein
MTGLEVVKMMKADPQLQDIPIIAVTAFRTGRPPSMCSVVPRPSNSATSISERDRSGLLNCEPVHQPSMPMIVVVRVVVGTAVVP